MIAARCPRLLLRRPYVEFAAALAALGLQVGDTALDLGCGTGRAVEPLRAAVGPRGRVLALDAALEMLHGARLLGRGSHALLIQVDVVRLPIAAGCADAIFAGGLLPHLADPAAALRELARVARPGARLVIFRPIGRVALATHHGGVPSDDDVIAPGRLASLCTATGWLLLQLDDAVERATWPWRSCRRRKARRMAELRASPIRASARDSIRRDWRRHRVP